MWPGVPLAGDRSGRGEANPGFDLLSIRPDGRHRIIDVIGRVRTDDVEVSLNEWAPAVNIKMGIGCA